MSRRDEIVSRLDAAEVEASRIRHESVVTCRILSKLAPRISIPELKRAADDKSPIHLGLLKKALPDFPLKLFTKNVPYLAEVGVNQLLCGDLFSLHMFRCYLEEIEHLGWDETKSCIGMVMPWPHATEAVLHNWTHLEETLDRRKGFGKFTMVTGKFNPPRVYYLESLDSLIAGVAATMPQE